jgi:hypothetical protein
MMTAKIFPEDYNRTARLYQEIGAEIVIHHSTLSERRTQASSRHEAQWCRKHVSWHLIESSILPWKYSER